MRQEQVRFPKHDTAAAVHKYDSTAVLWKLQQYIHMYMFMLIQQICPKHDVTRYIVHMYVCDNSVVCARALGRGDATLCRPDDENDHVALHYTALLIMA